MQHNRSFDQYIQSLGGEQFNPIDISEERNLISLYHASGSVTAYNRLVNTNLRFVVYFLRNYRIDDSVDIMDVIQEGNIGLIEGVQKYDPLNYSCKVFTYCSYWIRFRVNRFLKKSNKITNNSVSTDDISDLSSDDYEAEKIGSDVLDHFFFGLDDTERLVLKLYFGLQYPFTSQSLIEVGSKLHLNLERVRMIKIGAIEKLRSKEFLSLIR